MWCWVHDLHASFVFTFPTLYLFHDHLPPIYHLPRTVASCTPKRQKPLRREGNLATSRPGPGTDLHNLHAADVSLAWQFWEVLKVCFSFFWGVVVCLCLWFVWFVVVFVCLLLFVCFGLLICFVVGWWLLLSSSLSLLFDLLVYIGFMLFVLTSFILLVFLIRVLRFFEGFNF